MTNEQAGKTENKYATREELRQHIADVLGIEFSPGTMNQLCMPSRGEGPPVAGYIGKKPFYRLEEGIAWARSRLRPRKYVQHPMWGKQHQEQRA
jgi:hypothetical protein